MSRLAPAVALLLAGVGGCTWSNSLYQARRLSNQALQLERQERPFEAQTMWGRAAVRADTAFARQPGGEAGAEALWLRGRALARSGSCPLGVTSLEGALAASPGARYRDELELELALCFHRVGDTRAMALFERLQQSADPEVRRAARIGAGRGYVSARQWDAAIAALEGIDAPDARMDRALALIALQRRVEGLRELDPLTSVLDSLRDWSGFVEALSQVDAVATDSVLAALRSTGSAVGSRRNALLLAAARGAVIANDSESERRLHALMAVPDQGVASQGRLLVAERLLAGPANATALRLAVDSVRRLAVDDGAAAARFAVLGRIAETIASQQDSVGAGAPQGDMLTFVHAEAARDSLAAPRLAASLLARLERDWPASPYVAKALLARMHLEPDSADAFRARLALHPDSPYLAYLQGRETEQFAELEIALVTFAQLRRVRGAPPARARPADAGAAPGVDIP